MQNIEAVLAIEQNSRLYVFGHRTQKLLVIASQSMKKTACRIQSRARMHLRCNPLPRRSMAPEPFREA